MSARVWMVLCLVWAPSVVQAHGGSVHDEPWVACEDAALSDACAYTNDQGDLYRGTCRSMQARLLCVRNQPIVRADLAEGRRPSEMLTQPNERTPLSAWAPQALLGVLALGLWGARRRS